MILEVKNVSKSFGGVVALKDCTLSLEKNRVYGLIGPNGSGKTTLFNVITGFLNPESGDVLFKGERITGKRPRQIVERGIARTFQLTRVFLRMTVLENLLVVATSDDVESAECRELLNLTGLSKLVDEPVKNLSYGQRKQLEFARIMLMNPDLVMLDEPMAGLTGGMIDKMLEQIRFAQANGKTVFLIEHNLPVIMNICEHVFVLEGGLKIAEGTPAEIQRAENVVRAYLGDG